jgi:hypothetical protein
VLRHRRALNALRPRVEILYFEGCPNYEEAKALVERVAAQVGVEPEIGVVKVRDTEEAIRLRFLGSPTIRIEGRDVEPDAEKRTDFVLACRVYRPEGEFSRQPDESWVRDALTCVRRRATWSYGLRDER